MTNSNDSKSAVLIQVGGAPGGTMVSPEMSAEDFIQATPEKLQSIARAISDSMQPIFDAFSNMASRPSECTLEFGVNAGGEVGVPFVTKGTVGANFKISLKWDWSKNR